MDTFEIRTVLLYNPSLKSPNRKALEDEIQDTKILFYEPKSSEIEEKRFHVGLAEGTQSFFDSMLCEGEPRPKYQIIHTKTEVYINKEVEPNIWIFLGIRKSVQRSYSNEKEQYISKEVHRYDDQVFNEQLCLNIVNHLYDNFRTFNGEIGAICQGRERLEDLERVMIEFISRYIYLNENRNTRKLSLSFYEFEGLRIVPLDHNYSLKFNFFHYSSKNFDPSIEESLIFYNGYLAFSSLPPEAAVFFYNYYFSLGEPFQFDEWKLLNKFSPLQSDSHLTMCKYGYFINSAKYGTQKKRLKSTVEVNQDLLGLEDEETINGIEISLFKGSSARHYHLNTYHQNKLFIINLCNKSRTIQKVQLHNKLIKDNIERFCSKMNSILAPLSSHQEFYRFLYLNLATMGGKMTFVLEDPDLHNCIKHMILQLMRSKEVSLLQTTNRELVYGVRRISRIAILIVSNELPIHKVEENFDRLCREYFETVYM